ncbi:type II toxin-antitoxin system VapC family toxin [Cyanobium sp. ATX 6A2]|uniref:type II toxin-antitoxin system VapC family toxin n=1 Tax=Cyanobium sp. ATX 6A2 TaxID=2823700 RepID=UPI0020CB9A93|nr:type II toxin-antitoxin system VapC family toxin [Cyanobium sp. ATX 6A2]MCP9888960.1 type II toxin-antitoxin system VapC family toxin [Cyanobium sp. ATX 6A2]
MRVYLDTSLLVAALIREPGTDTAKRFLQAAEGQDWLLSAWTEVELASALSIKCRSGVVSATESAEALQRYSVLRDARCTLVTLEAQDFQTARDFCANPTPAIRAGDALHLAVCQRQRSALASFDRELCNAAEHYRIALERLEIPGQKPS